jgi:hypothetical protein
VPGALLTLCAAQGAGSFWLNASAGAGSAGTLVHSASGLCVDAASPPSTGSLDVVLNACLDAPAVALRQVFTLGANGAADFIALASPSSSGTALGLTAGVGAGVVAAACAPAGGPAPQVQSFVLDAQGHLAAGFAPLVADAGPSAPYFRGAATALVRCGQPQHVRRAPGAEPRATAVPDALEREGVGHGHSLVVVGPGVREEVSIRGGTLSQRRQ